MSWRKQSAQGGIRHTVGLPRYAPPGVALSSLAPLASWAALPSPDQESYSTPRATPQGEKEWQGGWRTESHKEETVDQVKLPGGGASMLQDRYDLESRRLMNK